MSEIQYANPDFNKADGKGRAEEEVKQEANRSIGKRRFTVQMDIKTFIYPNALIVSCSTDASFYVI